MLTGVLRLLTSVVALAMCAASSGASFERAPGQSGAIDLDDFDRTCAACDDMFRFVNGGWMRKNLNDPGYPRWGRFEALREKHLERLRHMLEAAGAPGQPRDRALQALGDHYASCMNTEQLEAIGAAPLRDRLSQIDAMSGAADVVDMLAALHAEGSDAVFRFGAGSDEKNPARTIAIARQGGLGLPDPSYYTQTDQHSTDLRDAYVSHVARMLSLLGDPPERATTNAGRVLHLERSLAVASRSAVEQRDPLASYHLMSIDQLDALTPGFSWPRYLRALGRPDIREVNVRQPRFMEQFNGLLSSLPIETWKAYLRWQFVHGFAPALSSPFANEHVDFYERRLAGASAQPPRWTYCLDSTEQGLGQILGREYVRHLFPPEARARAVSLVRQIAGTLRSQLQQLSWMTEPTRRHAVAKLDAMTFKIGYPDQWPAGDPPEIRRDRFVENMRRLARAEAARNLATAGAPARRDEWTVPAHTMNAYYEHESNELVLPAGILQPPLFDAAAPDAVNYGAIGALIGHELTHAFDDEGRHYDAAGMLRDWWTPEDEAAFRSRASCLEQQFSAFTVQDGLHLNGKLVLGETIADLGGLTLAYVAFQGTRPSTREGEAPFTDAQWFFIGWTRLWATRVTPEYERNSVRAQSHPLPRFRAIAPLQNMPAFSDAFSCERGTAMVRTAAERCAVW